MNKKTITRQIRRVPVEIKAKINFDNMINRVIEEYYEDKKAKKILIVRPNEDIERKLRDATPKYTLLNL